VKTGSLDSEGTRWAEALDGIETVIHAASRVHMMRDVSSDPLAEFRRVNTTGTLRLAREAATVGVRRFVFLSSVKVHGESSAHNCPLVETAPPAPNDAYAISKREAEDGLRAIAASSGMEVVIIRPPLVYGPGVKANFASLMRAIARGIPLPLGALHNRRSLVSLTNLVSFIITCMSHPNAANETFLVSDGEDLSTADLARRITVAMNKPERLIAVPPLLVLSVASILGRRASAERLCGNLQVDIAKAQSVLGWSPPISVDEGLRRTVASYCAA
jgi:nucleoside-diphosphate-sugar epimerase